ncbi:MAG TPA: hypothetical protein VLV31_03175 [Candidatus Acidoferrales bacterium]|nr:hypothetical protein [Candidatus Acidoferrales bacterium]
MDSVNRLGWIRDGGNWIIAYAIALHLFWGAFILISAAPLQTTPIHTVAEVVQAFSGPNRFAVGAVFLIAAGLSYLGLSSKRSLPSSILLMMPQQGLLVLTAIGGVLAAINGHYADGVPRSAMFILADQFPPVLIAAAHTFAIVAFGRGFLPNPVIKSVVN